MWTYTTAEEPTRPDPADDLAVCLQAIRDGSKSFHAASLLLPRHVREGAFALYAFCRVADDAVDEGGCSKRAVSQLRRRLDAAYAGRPEDDPVDRAFSLVVKANDIPKEIPSALIDGFAWDAAGRRYETLDHLKDYAARVAGTVGVMMALVMGVRDPLALARACDLGIAMQLTNIARDIGEDARAGRIYLPIAWLREEGLAPEDLLGARSAGPEMRALTARLLEAAGAHYRAGLAGADFLPSSCRPAIRAAGLIYAGIGDAIARSGYDTIAQRAFVTRARKCVLAARAYLPSPSQPVLRESAPPPASLFLLDAIRHARPAWAPPPKRGSYAWMVDLFMRLETRERHLGEAIVR